MKTIYKLIPEDWIDNYADQLYAYCQARINNKQMAEDLVQDTFLSAWKARETYKSDASEKNWLFAICKNKIIDYYRKNKGNYTHMGKDDSDSYFNSEDHWTGEKQPNDWGINGIAHMEKKEFYQAFAICKQKLKDVQQQVFILKYMEDVDSDQICKILGITASNYWILIHRAKLNLRSCLEKNWIKI
jgi:RNA polymerase sigma-70 factor (TIGR02943 family)